MEVEERMGRGSGGASKEKATTSMEYIQSTRGVQARSSSPLTMAGTWKERKELRNHDADRGLKPMARKVTTARSERHGQTHCRHGFLSHVRSDGACL